MLPPYSHFLMARDSLIRFSFLPPSRRLPLDRTAPAQEYQRAGAHHQRERQGTNARPSRGGRRLGWSAPALASELGRAGGAGGGWWASVRSVEHTYVRQT